MASRRPSTRPQRCSCLPLTCGEYGKRRQVQDAEVMQSRGELPGDHRRAVVGHQRARQAHLLQRLAQAVDQFPAALVRVPLGMAEEPRAVIDEADQERFDVGAAAGQHLARAVMEVEVQQLQDVFDFVAAYLALLEPIAGGNGPVAAALRRPPAQQPLRFEVASDARVRRAPDAGGGERNPQVVVVQLRGPARVIVGTAWSVPQRPRPTELGNRPMSRRT